MSNIGQQNLNTKYILNLGKLFKIVLNLKCFLWMRINSSFELFKLVNTPKLEALLIIKIYVVNLVDIAEAVHENVSKLQVWSCLYYGTLPCVIGSCCAER